MELPLDDPFYRPRIIAERTGKHYDTVTAAIRAGALKSVKLGRRSIGVRASEVQRWLDALAAGDPAAAPAHKRKAAAETDKARSEELAKAYAEAKAAEREIARLTGQTFGEGA